VHAQTPAGQVTFGFSPDHRNGRPVRDGQRADGDGTIRPQISGPPWSTRSQPACLRGQLLGYREKSRNCPHLTWILPRRLTGEEQRW
jgi:hypothetical protein